MGRNTVEIGKEGEHKAVLHLQQRDFTILRQNYRYKKCEIDIIAQKGKVLHFIEVKYRKNKSYGTPESFVSEEQADRISMGAEQFVEENLKYESLEWSFDIVAIIAHPYEIILLEEAF